MKRAIKRQLRIWYSDIAGYLSKLKTFHRTALGIILAIVIIFAARKYWLDPIRAEVTELESKYKDSDPPEPLPTIESDEEITLAKEQIISREKNAETKKKEMETIAKARPKITQQNKETVLSEFASIISKNKLTVALRTTPEPENTTKSNTTKPTSTKPTSTKSDATKPKNTPKTQPKKPATKNINTKPKKSEPETKTINIEQALKTEEYIYYLEGTFQNQYEFLKQIENFPYPIKITKLYFGADETNDPITKTTLHTHNPQQTRQENLHLKFNLILYFHN
ncbi:MAG: hypothetical protein LBP59_01835 [Planctomycetaceae bacterium]|jgi:hypothetical protein|nr:hypothetical protein [Planctomycetaceae bacterium]